MSNACTCLGVYQNMKRERVLVFKCRLFLPVLRFTSQFDVESESLVSDCYCLCTDLVTILVSSFKIVKL